MPSLNATVAPALASTREGAHSYSSSPEVGTFARAWIEGVVSELASTGKRTIAPADAISNSGASARTARLGAFTVATPSPLRPPHPRSPLTP